MDIKELRIICRSKNLKIFVPPVCSPLIAELFQYVVVGDLAKVQALLEKNHCLTESDNIHPDSVETVRGWLSYHLGTHAIHLAYVLKRNNLLRWLVAQFGVMQPTLDDRSLIEVINDDIFYNEQFRVVMSGVQDRHPERSLPESLVAEGVDPVLAQKLPLKKYNAFLGISTFIWSSESRLNELKWLIESFNIAKLQACNYSALTVLAQTPRYDSPLPLVIEMFKAGGLLDESDRMNKELVLPANTVLTDEKEGHIVFQFAKRYGDVTRWLVKNLDCLSVRLNDGRNLYQYALEEGDYNTFKSLAIDSGIFDACGVLISLDRFKKECLQMVDTVDGSVKGLPCMRWNERNLYGLLDSGVPLHVIIQALPDLGFLDASYIPSTVFLASDNPVAKAIGRPMLKLGSTSPRLDACPLTHTLSRHSVLDRLLSDPNAIETIIERLNVKGSFDDYKLFESASEKLARHKHTLPKPSVPLGELIKWNKQLPRDDSRYGEHLSLLRHDVLINIWCLYHAQRIEASFFKSQLDLEQAEKHLKGLISCYEYWDSLNKPRFLPIVLQTLVSANELTQDLPESATRLTPLFVKAVWPISTLDIDRLVWESPEAFEKKVALQVAKTAGVVSESESEQAVEQAVIWSRELLKLTPTDSDANSQLDTSLLIKLIDGLVRFKTDLLEKSVIALHIADMPLFNSVAFLLFRAKDKRSSDDVKQRYLVNVIDEVLVLLSLKLAHLIISTHLAQPEIQYLLVGEAESKVEEIFELDPIEGQSPANFDAKVNQLKTALGSDEFKTLYTLLESPAIFAILIAKFGISVAAVMAYKSPIESDPFITRLTQEAIKLFGTPQMAGSVERIDSQDDWTTAAVGFALRRPVLFSGTLDTAKEACRATTTGDAWDMIPPEEHLAGAGAAAAGHRP